MKGVKDLKKRYDDLPVGLKDAESVNDTLRIHCSVLFTTSRVNRVE